MAIREGRWDCQYCGTIGNLGRHRQCQNCGRSRPEGTKFYLADDALITDKQLQRQALVGPDWVCEYCGTSNAADIQICGSCGAPRGESTPVQKVTDYEPGQAPTSGDMTFDEKPDSKEPTDEKQKSRPKIPTIAIIAVAVVGILCLAIGAFLIFSGSDTEAVVSSFEWERAVDIEQFQTVVEEDWQLPSEARLLSQRQEIHHYEQILDHYETRQREIEEQVQVGSETYVCGQRDLGNGFFEDIECERPIYETQTRIETYEEPIYRDEPIFQPLYTYEIDKWIVINTEIASGNDHEPFWPRVNLSDGKREGDTEEYYLVIFTDSDGNIYEWDTSLDDWESFELGQRVILKLNSLGTITEIQNP